MFDDIKSQFTRTSSRNILIIAVILSLIFGGGAGAAVGFFVTQNAQVLWSELTNFPVPKVTTKEVKGPSGKIIGEEEATIAAVREAAPATVSIAATKDLSKFYQGFELSPFEEFFGLPLPFSAPAPREGKQQVGGGTGFLISSDGLVLTNKHVVSDTEAEYTVITSEGKQYPLKILAQDSFIDVAIGEIEANNLPTVRLGDSDKLEIGQTVIAIGNSLSEFRNTVTKGVISGRNRRVVAGGGGFSEVIEEALQTDAAINPGNSGGPLINLAGEVIGVNTAVSRAGQLIGFAIPINSVKSVVDSVKKFGKIVRAYLGVRFIVINETIAKTNKLPRDYGALVLRGQRPEELAVMPGSPADKAGLVENDIILEIDGQKITEEQSLARVVRAKKPGDKVTLKILHKGEEKNITVELGEFK